MIRFVFALVAIVGMLFHMTLAALLVGLILDWTGLTKIRAPLFWLAAAPAIYVLWLVILTALHAIDTRFIAPVKPRRLSTRDGRRAILTLIRVTRLYRTAARLDSLPLLGSFTLAPLLRGLMLRAYSPGATVGKWVVVFGRIFDPDLTRIGDRVIIGAGASLVAHTLTANPDGGFDYASAPIRIDDGAVIGGESFVGLGVTVGADAIVELGSIVAPYTVIPPGEVWGGNPAVFRRRRSTTDADDTVTVPRPAGPSIDGDTADADLDLAIQRLIAYALDLPVDEVDAATGPTNCPQWDSLGQMAIAAAVHDRFGIVLDPQQVFSLRSAGDIAECIAGRSRPQASAVDEFPDDPDLLPLMDPAVVTRELTRRLHYNSDPAREVPVAVAASFTAEPLAGTLRVWSHAFGIDVRTTFCGFDQVAQTLLSPGGPFSETGGGLNVVLMRVEDLPGRSIGEKAAAAEELLDAIEHRAARPAGGGVLVVGSLPPTVLDYPAVEQADADVLRMRWRERLASIATVEMLDFAGVVQRIGTEAATSASFEVLARTPYTQRLYQQLGIALTRVVRRCCGAVAPAKVVAVDADGTLWGGVVAEDGIDGIEVGDDGKGRAFQLFQHKLLQLKGQGLLLAVVSRNEESDLREVFERHPGMVLKADDVAVWQVNWNAKSDNLRQVARELNVGLDSIVLLDDDPAVRLEVAARVPEVHVVPLPAEPERYVATLDRLWLFDRQSATEEDRSRTRMIAAERQRRKATRSAVGLEDYLNRLELHVNFRPAGSRDLPRVAQLTQKTNQFNLSLRRRSLEQVKTLGPETDTYVVSARDRFGEYGTVGVGILGPARGRAGDVELETFLLSCRALGRGIEQAFLARLCDAASARGARSLHAPFVEGPRNKPVRHFLEQSGFVVGADDTLERQLDDTPPMPSHITWEPAVDGR